MDEHDLDRGPLLIVVRRHRRWIETNQQQHERQPRQPRQQARGQRQEPGGIGQIDQRHFILLMVVAVTGNRDRSAPRELIGPWSRTISALSIASVALAPTLMNQIMSPSSVESVPQAGGGSERSDHETDQR